MSKVSIDISEGSFRLYEHGGRLLLQFHNEGVEVTIRLHPATALVMAASIIEKAPYVGKGFSMAVTDQCVNVAKGSFGKVVKGLAVFSEQSGLHEHKE